MSYTPNPFRDRSAAYFHQHGRKCQICGSTTKVELHRLSYDFQLGLEPDSALIALCCEHRQRVLEYAKSVQESYDVIEASVIWLRMTRAGKEPNRPAMKASQGQKKRRARQRYANKPRALRHR